MIYDWVLDGSPNSAIVKHLLYAIISLLDIIHRPVFI
jgi:hypothetical protein